MHKAALEYVYDKEKAEKLLDDLGYTQKMKRNPPDETGEPLSFEIITYAGNDIRSRARDDVKTELAEVGGRSSDSVTGYGYGRCLYLAGF